MFWILSMWAVRAEPDVSPVVAILGVPVGQECITYAKQPGARADQSCFYSMFSKWLEAAGATVVGIPYDASPELIDQILASVNGVLFTGGEVDIYLNNSYVEFAQYVLQRAIQINDKGTYFPVWGTCMGFQVLSMVIGQDDYVLERGAFDSEHISLPLQLTSQANTSRLFGRMRRDVFDILTKQNVTSNLHHDGIRPATFESNLKLKEFFNVLSINYDRKNKAFVSTIEAKRYPVYGVQWHPERPQFDWSEGEGIDHGAQSVFAMQQLASFFVEETRLNGQRFASRDLHLRFSVYTLPLTPIGDPLEGNQAYVFRA